MQQDLLNRILFQCMQLQQVFLQEHLEHVNLESLLNLYALLPYTFQVFYQDIFQIIDSGPSVRRSVLDWGLFHVKHDYYDLWKNYRRALKQRNSLLRIKAKPNEFVP